MNEKDDDINCDEPVNIYKNIENIYENIESVLQL